MEMALKNPLYSPAVVAHPFNPSTGEAEKGESLGARGQPGLQS